MIRCRKNMPDNFRYLLTIPQYEFIECLKNLYNAEVVCGINRTYLTLHFSVKNQTNEYSFWGCKVRITNDNFVEVSDDLLIRAKHIYDFILNFLEVIYI